MDKYDGWVPWFSWYPTKIERGMWVWLRYIEVKRVPFGRYQRSLRSNLSDDTGWKGSLL